MSRPRTMVSGGTGFVGRFIVEGLLEAGHAVTVMGRTPPAEGFFPAPIRFVQGMLDPDRDQSAVFAGIENFVHTAFDHVPGKYRGGEGGDASGFRHRNVEGSIALFEAAREAGVRRAVFLSSRAIYGSQEPGAVLTEETMPRPDTLYGQVKLAAEKHLGRMIAEGWTGASLRITGVYGPAGPGRDHKWSGPIRDYLAGKPIEPRAGTEVHGNDVARAVSLILTVDQNRLRQNRPGQTGNPAFNVSDIVVDRRDLLAIVKDVTGYGHPLPRKAEAAELNVMATDKLRALGWRPGGAVLFRETVRALASEIRR